MQKNKLTLGWARNAIFAAVFSSKLSGQSDHTFKPSLSPGTACICQVGVCRAPIRSEWGLHCWTRGLYPRKPLPAQFKLFPWLQRSTLVGQTPFRKTWNICCLQGEIRLRWIWKVPEVKLEGGERGNVKARCRVGGLFLSLSKSGGWSASARGRKVLSGERGGGTMLSTLP